MARYSCGGSADNMNKYWLFALVLIIPFAFSAFVKLSFWGDIFLGPVLGYSDLLILAIAYEFVKKKKPEEKKILKCLMIASVVWHVVVFALAFVLLFF